MARHLPPHFLSDVTRVLRGVSLVSSHAFKHTSDAIIHHTDQLIRTNVNVSSVKQAVEKAENIAVDMTRGVSQTMADGIATVTGKKPATSSSTTVTSSSSSSSSSSDVKSGASVYTTTQIYPPPNTTPATSTTSTTSKTYTTSKPVITTPVQPIPPTSTVFATTTSTSTTTPVSTSTSTSTPTSSNTSSSTSTSAVPPTIATPFVTPTPSSRPASPSSTPVIPYAPTPSPHSSSHAGYESAFTQDRYQPRERAVPASPMARIIGFGQVGASIVLGSAMDSVKRSIWGTTPSTSSTTSTSTSTSTSPSPSTSTSSTSIPSSSSTKSEPMLNQFMSEQNAERLAEGLCRMRGAALKVGQMLSIQDDSLLPPQLQAILDRVRDGADVMPRKQLEKALETELGMDWQSKLQSFDFKPMAAASIGQVHAATLLDGTPVVIKVQYPGVAESISSDINNLKRLIRFVNVLPKGMYLDETMKAAKEELTIECDYQHEAACQRRFRSLLANESRLSLDVNVPRVIDHLSTKRVLTTERVTGVPIDRLAVGGSLELSQYDRDRVADILLRLCLTELFKFRFMQTDPNWSNFLYNQYTGMIHLIDFGASREYKKSFVDDYLRMVYACAERDRDGVIEMSIRLGFLTGDESKEMLDAHVEAGFIVGEPFATEGPYDFVKGNIAGRISQHASIMLKHRLTPPPKEAYTLHRKLSGAFLTCKKLDAKLACRETFMKLYRSYPFGDVDPTLPRKVNPTPTAPATPSILFDTA